MKRAVANILSELFILVGPSPGMRTVYLAFLHYCVFSNVSLYGMCTVSQLYHGKSGQSVRLLANGKSGRILSPPLFIFLWYVNSPLLGTQVVVVHNKPKILESDNQRNLIWRSCCDHLKCCDSCPLGHPLRAKLGAVE